MTTSSAPCPICEEAALRQRTASDSHPSRDADFTYFRAFRNSDYKNMYEVPGYETEARVFGTESLYGDWEAEVLLLAQDFAPWRTIEDRLAYDPTDAFRAGCRCKDGAKFLGVRSNETLVQHYVSELPPETRLLYGSARGGLMRLGDKDPGLKEIRRVYCVPLLDFVIARLPNLRAIVSLGKEAWRVMGDLSGRTVDFRSARDAAWTIEYRGVSCFAAAHPRVFFSSHGREPWLRVVKELRR
jgi:hypothetical protein